MTQRDELREEIAREAARLMYEEEVREYRTAKHKAAKKFGSVKALQLGSHLPSNAEIHREVRRLVAFYEGPASQERLLRLRLIALEMMELLEPFQPRLIGSVLSGGVTERSDIDLQLFADSSETVEEYLKAREVSFVSEVVSIRRGSDFVEYPHLYLEEGGVEIECTIYEEKELRRLPKSSITCKSIERADVKKVRRLVLGMVGGARTR